MLLPKRLLFGFFVFLIGFSASAQHRFNYALGYNTGIHLKNGGLDFVVDRYNQNNSLLTQKLQSPRFFYGINFGADMFLPKNRIATVEWTNRRSNTQAIGNDTLTNTLFKRDLQYRVNNLSVGIGFKIKSKTEGVTGFYYGADLCFISVKTYTRNYQSGALKPDYTNIDKNLALGFSPHLKYLANRFVAKAYLQFMLSGVDYMPVNKALNPLTYTGDASKDTKGRTTSFGISFKFYLLQNAKK
jgi:hypothetical protein